jgi:hypothetical protein
MRAASNAGTSLSTGQVLHPDESPRLDGRLLKLEFTTLFEYLQLLRVVADELQVRR